ncbi:unnamed protein product [Closterium sp. NIES-53]
MGPPSASLSTQPFNHPRPPTPFPHLGAFPPRPLSRLPCPSAATSLPPSPSTISLAAIPPWISPQCPADFAARAFPPADFTAAAAKSPPSDLVGATLPSPPALPAAATCFVAACPPCRRDLFPRCLPSQPPRPRRRRLALSSPRPFRRWLPVPPPRPHDAACTFPRYGYVLAACSTCHRNCTSPPAHPPPAIAPSSPAHTAAATAPQFPPQFPWPRLHLRRPRFSWPRLHCRRLLFPLPRLRFAACASRHRDSRPPHSCRDRAVTARRFRTVTTRRFRAATTSPPACSPHPRDPALKPTTPNHPGEPPPLPPLPGPPPPEPNLGVAATPQLQAAADTTVLHNRRKYLICKADHDVAVLNHEFASSERATCLKLIAEYNTSMATYISNSIAWAAAYNRACTILLDALPDALMRRFQAREMRAHLIWTELQSMFEHRDISSVGVLFQEYFSITLATYDGAVDYVGCIQEVADRLATCQAALSEPLQIHRPLFNLIPLTFLGPPPAALLA